MLFYVRGSKFVKIAFLFGLLIYRGYNSATAVNQGHPDKLTNSQDLCCSV